MENVSDALKLAAGVLLAMLIIFVIVFVWGKIGESQDALDDPKKILSKAEFNETFLAYRKNLMYGTDVLSCLNKAQNNNQRYVYNNYYGTDTEDIGADTRNEFLIDVEVKLKENSDLKETLNVYYRNSSGKTVRIAGKPASPIETNFDDKLFGNYGIPHFDIPTVYYYYFQDGKIVKKQMSYSEAMWGNSSQIPRRTIQQILNDGDCLKTNFSSGESYHLLSGINNENVISPVASRKQASVLSALLSTVTLMEQTIINSPKPSNFNDSDWYSATWKTASYDFKTRKFKCVDVHYNETTGYIDRISFEEI